MLEIAAIKSSLLSSLMTGVMTTVSPNYATLDFSVIATDNYNCTHLCINADTQAEELNNLNNIDSGDLSYNVGNMW